MPWKLHGPEEGPEPGPSRYACSGFYPHKSPSVGLPGELLPDEEAKLLKNLGDHLTNLHRLAGGWPQAGLGLSSISSKGSSSSTIRSFQSPAAFEGHLHIPLMSELLPVPLPAASPLTIIEPSPKLWTK